MDCLRDCLSRGMRHWEMRMRQQHVSAETCKTKQTNKLKCTRMQINKTKTYIKECCIEFNGSTDMQCPHAHHKVYSWFVHLNRLRNAVCFSAAWKILYTYVLNDATSKIHCSVQKLSRAHHPNEKHILIFPHCSVLQRSVYMIPNEPNSRETSEQTKQKLNTSWNRCFQFFEMNFVAALLPWKSTTQS